MTGHRKNLKVNLLRYFSNPVFHGRKTLHNSNSMCDLTKSGFSLDGPTNRINVNWPCNSLAVYNNDEKLCLEVWISTTRQQNMIQIYAYVCLNMNMNIHTTFSILIQQIFFKKNSYLLVNNINEYDNFVFILKNATKGFTHLWFIN